MSYGPYTHASVDSIVCDVSVDSFVRDHHAYKSLCNPGMRQFKQKLQHLFRVAFITLIIAVYPEAII